ncbi:MAG: PGF-CTERM sorting domain-containing protein [Archaeoglobaceae archaeon]
MRFLIFLIFLVLKANALGIFIEGKDIVAEAEDLCAFEIEIAFDLSSSVQNLSIEKPFNGDFNIDREAGIIKIVGFSAEPLNGKINLAKMEFEGELKINFAKLYDSEGREIFSIGALTPERTPVYTSTPVRTPTTPKEVPTTTETPEKSETEEIPAKVRTPMQTTPESNPETVPADTKAVVTPFTTQTTPKTTQPIATTPAEKPFIPGFEVIFAIAGLAAIAYLLRRES